MTQLKYSLYVIFVLTLTGTLIFFSQRSVFLFIDLPSFLFLLIAYLIATFTVVGAGATSSYFKVVLGKEKRSDVTTSIIEEASTYFRNMIIFFTACGVVGFLTGVIMMLADISDRDAIGPNLAVALIVPFYAAMIIVLVPVPFRFILNRKRV